MWRFSPRAFGGICRDLSEASTDVTSIQKPAADPSRVLPGVSLVKDRASPSWAARSVRAYVPSYSSWRRHYSYGLYRGSSLLDLPEGENPSPRLAAMSFWVAAGLSS